MASRIEAGEPLSPRERASRRAMSWGLTPVMAPSGRSGPGAAGSVARCDDRPAGERPRAPRVGRARAHGDAQPRREPAGHDRLGRPRRRRDRLRAPEPPPEGAERRARPARLDLARGHGDRTRWGSSHYLVVHGRARVTEGGAPELLQRLAETYVGPGVKFPPMPDPPPGYVIRLTPERILGVGPWAE